MKISPFSLNITFNEDLLNNAFEDLIDIINPEINFNFENFTYFNIMNKIKNIPINQFSNYLKRFIELIEKENLNSELIDKFFQDNINKYLPNQEEINGYIGNFNKKMKKDGLGFLSEKFSEKEEINMFGNFSNDTFIDGTILLNKQILKVGNFDEGFKGIIIEDLNVKKYKIGKEINNKFYGIELKKNSINYSVYIKTNNYIFTSENIDLISFHIKKIKDTIFNYSSFFIEKDKYFYALNSQKIKCLYKIISENDSIISYEKDITQDENFSEDTIIKILYNNNNIFIGTLLIDKINYNEGEYIIRNKNKSQKIMRYVGKWENGKFINGKIYEKNKLIFEGDFNNNEACKGKCYFDLVTYEGEIKNFQLEGKGKLMYKSGIIFEGNFMNGRPNGEGILTKNGKEYKINFI